MHEKTQHLATLPIGKLLLSQSTPAIIGMLVMALYNFVDSIFIGQFIGEEGLAATGIIFPIQMILGAFAMALGVGTASIISRETGAKNLTKVSQVFGTFQILLLLLMVILSIGMIIFMPDLILFFGATPDILQFSQEYLFPLLLGSVFFAFSMGNNNILRSVGHAKSSMKIMLVSAAVNLALDPLLIKGFGFGMAGAAWATVISRIVSCIMILRYYKSSQNIIPIVFSNFRIRFAHAKEIILLGIPTFFRQIVGSLIMIIVNNYLKIYGGTQFIAIYGVMNKVLQIFMMPMFGIIQGMQPIVGYNYGAKLYDRAKNVVLLSIKILTFFCTTLAILYLVFPTFLVDFFSSDINLINNTGEVMQIVLFAFPVVGFQIVAGAMYQALGYIKKAFFLSLLRQVFFFLPVFFLLITIMEDKIFAIWVTFPITDFLSSILTLIIFIPDFKKLGNGQNNYINIKK